MTKNTLAYFVVSGKDKMFLYRWPQRSRNSRQKFEDVIPGVSPIKISISSLLLPIS